ncbi:GGDEF domain-containing protein [Chitinilyticum piscinae]|uniref:diguanylate cyclase n=1 Tax=Chitinilyticum piscinae TaxID=2866724 RepID=A0A8J7FME0_9NEIS|nr:GGDEF domain-containing protein [Chitinilyticum piscinae]MBE9610275.1 GGDEF domain-containing protein [Chitinilyticum piscinae]
MPLAELLALLDHDPHCTRQQALALARQSGWSSTAGLQARVLAARALGRFDYPAAIREINGMLGPLRRSKLIRDWLELRDEAGGHCMVTGELEQAIQHWSACLELALEQHEADYAARALTGLGKSFWVLQDHASARHYHNRAVEFALPLLNRDILCAAYLCLTVDLLALGDLDTANCTLALLARPISLCRNRHWQAEYWLYRATVSAQDDAAQSNQQLDQAELIARELGFGWVLSQVAWQRFCNARDNVSAELHFAEAIRSAEAINSATLLERYTLKASEDAAARGDYPAALQHYKAFLHHFAHNHALQKLPRLSTAARRRLLQLEDRINLALQEQEYHNLRLTITRQGNEILNLAQAASTDPLTGLHNRRHLEKHFSELREHPRLPCSILILDADHFKQINDRFGHDLGDVVLTRLAELLRSTCRNHELIARYGGEEFVLLLPDTGGSAAQQVAERLRMAIEQYAWTELQSTLHVTASFGGACCEAPPFDGPALLRLADQALYRAKQQGRNRVEWAFAPTQRP